MCDLSLANDSPARPESARQVLGHSKMPSSFPRLDAQGPCVRMYPAQSRPKPSDTFKDVRAKFSNIDFFLKILPLKDDELVMPEM